MSEDVLRLRHMRFVGRHGVFPWERTRGQPFDVDVELQLDLAPAGRDDDLALSVDYAAVRDCVEQIVTGPPVQLIEALAERIAAALGSRYAGQFGPLGVAVTVRKPWAPVPGDMGGVEVQIRRRYE